MSKKYKHIVIEERFFEEVIKFLENRMSLYKYFLFLHEKFTKEGGKLEDGSNITKTIKKDD